MNQNRTKRGRFIDFALYIGCSAILIGIIALMLVKGMSWDIFIKWIGFAVVTGVLFGLFVSEYRFLWRRAKFWPVSAILLVLHCAVWIPILLYIEHWKFVWFFPMLVEMAVFAYVRRKVVDSSL